MLLLSGSWFDRWIILGVNRDRKIDWNVSSKIVINENCLDDDTLTSLYIYAHILNIQSDLVEAVTGVIAAGM
jgi:hypothetical protein